MKCPECSTNHRYRSGMTCRCGYRFVLDPKCDGYADGRILAAFRKASAGETRYFTRNQLATEIQRMRPRATAPVVLGSLFLMAAIGMWFFDVELAVPSLLAGAFGVLLIYLGVGDSARLDIAKLNRAVEKYEATAKPCSFLLRDDRPLAEPPQDWPESDIYDYGVEGILIVGRPLLVDLFVLNGFHTENRMLVVSECGYPEYIVPHANRILREQPDVRVYALHDSTREGMQMATRLVDSDVFQLQRHKITDLGLNSDDVNQMPRLKKFEASGGVEVDHLKWSKLSNGTAAAIVGGIALVDVMDTDTAGSGMSFG
jgi:hypothetical protein